MGTYDNKFRSVKPDLKIDEDMLPEILSGFAEREERKKNDQ